MNKRKYIIVADSKKNPDMNIFYTNNNHGSFWTDSDSFNIKVFNTYSDAERVLYKLKYNNPRIELHSKLDDLLESNKEINRYINFLHKLFHDFLK